MSRCLKNSSLFSMHHLLLYIAQLPKVDDLKRKVINWYITCLLISGQLSQQTVHFLYTVCYIIHGTFSIIALLNLPFVIAIERAVERFVRLPLGDAESRRHVTISDLFRSVMFESYGSVLSGRFGNFRRYIH